MHFALLALLATAEANPVVAAQPSAQPAAQPSPPPAGKVVLVRDSSVVVDLGRDMGAAIGMRVELFRRVRLDLGDGEYTEREEPLAVGVIVATTQKRAEVLLGMNEVVPQGAGARTTDKPLSANRSLPPRVDGLWELSALIRPYVGLGEGALATQLELGVGRRMGNLHLQARVLPLGFGFAKNDASVVGAGYFLVSYDTHLFEIGLGPGFTTIEDSTVHQRNGAALAQNLRIGSVDGTSFSVLNAFYYGNKFEYAGTDAVLQAPAGDKLWLVARMGGSVAGYFEGELGLRILTEGNGGAGSIFLTPSLGGATQWHVPSKRCFGSICFQPPAGQTQSLTGPTIGFGIEARL